MSSSSEYTKWIGGFAGFMYGGFLGAFIGYHLGKRIGKNFGSKKQMFEMSFEMSLLVLATIVIRADGKIKKEELDCVRLFLFNHLVNLKLIFTSKYLMKLSKSLFHPLGQFASRLIKTLTINLDFKYYIFYFPSHTVMAKQILQK